MWICQQCGEEVEDTFDACWKCGTGQHGTAPEDPAAFQPEQVNPSSEPKDSSDYTALSLTTLGAIPLVVGLVLAVMQLTLTEEVAVVGGVVVRRNIFPESCLHVGLAGAVIGIVFMVGGLVRNGSTSSIASIPEQIELLAKLKEQGVLSDTEFEEKKRDLLSRL